VTYRKAADGGVTTEGKSVGHVGWPCPPAKDHSDSCAEAWQHWRLTAPVGTTLKPQENNSATTDTSPGVSE